MKTHPQAVDRGELQRRIADLEQANAHLRAVAAEDRRRAAALEEALARSYRCAVTSRPRGDDAA